MQALTELLAESVAWHRHLCPRQVLGVRMGMRAGELLGLNLPQTDKRLFTIVETDGCFTDGVSVATNCWVERRTMRVEDSGKVAATFVDTEIEQAIRIVPRSDVRQRACAYAPETRNAWEAQLLGYQRMPADELLSVQRVQLQTPIEKIVSQAGAKAVCEFCGEEILNEREVARDGAILCQACAGQAYYGIAAEGTLLSVELRTVSQDMLALLSAKQVVR